MLSEYIKDKEGNFYKSEQGEYLVKNTLELGDMFVPIWNSVVVKEKAEVENHYLKAMVKDVNDGENKEVYINLTPAQAGTMMSKTENGYDINQYKFITFNYSNKHGEFIGVGFEPSTPKPNTSLLDFNEEKEEVEQTDQ